MKGLLSAQITSVRQFLWKSCSCLQETCSHKEQLKTAHHLYKRFFLSSYIQILRLLQFLVLSKMGRAGTSSTGHDPVQTAVTPGVAPHHLSCGMTMVSNLVTPNQGLSPCSVPEPSSASRPCSEPTVSPVTTFLPWCLHHPSEGICLIAPVHLSSLFIP